MGCTSGNRCSYLEFDMGSFRGLGSAYGTHDLAGLDIPALYHTDVLQIQIEGVESSAVAQDHRGPITFEGSGQDDGP